VGVDADVGLGKAGADGADGGGDFRGKAPAIGIAEDEVVGSCFGGGFESAEGVIGIGVVAIKEVLRVIDDFASLFFEDGDGVGDHAKVFHGGGTKDFFDVKEPAFSEDGDYGGFRLEEEADLGIGGGVNVGSAGGAEGGEFGGAPVEFSGLGKEVSIFVVGARPTAFDVVKTVGGEAFGEAKFIGEREVNAFALGTIAQGGVVEGESGVGGHRYGC
jgi:hypothetical protein